ncbi:MAG: hypothetical protein KJ906_03500 [Nanoarchaeota archaeon]|nr:hypothetical protein [Nanoarchaeota archaeon]
MIKGGIGGAKTVTGLTFEKKTDIRTAFNKIKNYQIKDDTLLYKGNIVANMYSKYELYEKFLCKLNIKWEERISRRLLPDDSIFVFTNKTLFIIEMKFQNVEGSTDEKLQTCDFKLKQYKKLFQGSGIKIEYVYILNDWFKKIRYKDVLNYIKSVDCHYFFEKLPLKILGLPESIVS